MNMMLEMNEMIDKTPPRPLRIGEKAPVFRARTTQGEISLDQYRGRWLVFFSHPADFTSVCTSEFIALARVADKFEALNCALLGLSVDSLYAHIAWVRAIRDGFGVSVPFPIVEDPSMEVARAYGMLDESAQDSSAVRATYFIDPDGIIRAMSWYPMSVGRSVEEMLRLLTALQYSASAHCMTPEGWQPGGDVFLSTDLDNAASATDAPATWFCQLRPAV